MSGVQFNLLPDVKLEYVKTERSRRTVTTLAILCSAIALGILILMLFTVEVVQKKQLNDASKAVTTANKQLAKVPGLAKVLTVQNQLTALTTLHQSKHISSRFMTYLPEIAPANITINQASIDLAQNTMTISGTGSDQLAVNTFVDTLKFAQFKANPQDSNHTAFTSVVESAFGLSTAGATYTITANVDPALFANTGKTPIIILNNQVTTRSVLDDPSNQLFSGSTGSSSSSKSGGQ